MNKLNNLFFKSKEELNFSSISISSLLLTLFVDSLGIGMVYPVLIGLFYSTDFVSLHSDTSTLYLISILFSLYPITMFFGSPILSFASERYGRKRILILSLVGNSVGILFFIIGILTRSIIVIAIGRAISGFSAGNVPVAQAAIGTLKVSDYVKSKYIALISVFYGLGFTFGPLFIDITPLKYGMYSYVIPYTILLIFAFLNIIMLLFSQIESINAARQKIDVKLIKDTIINPKYIRYIIIFSIFIFCQFSVYQALPISLLKINNFSESGIATYMSLYAGIFSITLIVILPLLAKRFTLIKLMKSSLLVLSLSCCVFFFFQQETSIIWILNLAIPSSLGIFYVSCMTAITNTKTPIGISTGIASSITALIWAITPLTNAFLIDTFKANYPFFISIILFLLAYLVLVLFTRNLQIPEKTN